MDLLELFAAVLRAATFSVGGLSSLPLLRESLVVPGHVTEAQMIEALAIGRLSTGPNGMYVVSLGWFAASWPGAAIALAASILPPLTLVAAVAYIRRWLLTPWAAGIVRGIALSTSGLLVATGIQLLEIGIAQVLLATLAFAVTLQGRVHPALLIFGGATLGVALEAL